LNIDKYFDQQFFTALDINITTYQQSTMCRLVTMLGINKQSLQVKDLDFKKSEVIKVRE